MSDKIPPQPVAAAFSAAVEHHAEVVRRNRREPEFLKALGLSLPVSPADVKQAYLERAKVAHPDRTGGDPERFKRLQEAFDEAIRFAARNGKRLPWIGHQVPIYIAQRKVLTQVERLGGRVEVESFDWLRETVGEDFSLIADRLVEIDLTGCKVGDAELRQLMDDADGVQYLEVLRLADTEVGDRGAMTLVQATNLRVLDVRGTNISQKMRRQLAHLPQMVHVEGMVGWKDWWRRLWKG
jgi:hypothetical protein